MIWGVVLLPFFAIADGLVPCDGSAENPCNFAALMTLVKKVLGWILIMVAPISAIMFAYAGFLYMTSQGNVSKRQQANKVFTNVGIGLFFVVGAWLIVKAILAGLVTKEGYSYLKDAV